MENKLREKLAELQHDQWSGWMKYIWEKCEGDPDTETITIPKWAVTRWWRQMNTPYSELPEEEKESDRIEADKYLALIERERRAGAVEALEKLWKEIENMAGMMDRPPKGGFWWQADAVRRKFESAIENLKERSKND